MLKQIKTVSLTAAISFSLLTVGCKKELSNDGSGNYNRAKTAGFTNPTQSIPVNASGVIQDNFDGNSTDNIINLTANKVWLIDGISYVPGGKTLKIPAGTILSSGSFKDFITTIIDPNTGLPQTVAKSVRGVLVVVKSAKIDAEGTESQPIVFTSPNAPRNRAPGDFGGLFILSNSFTNKPATSVIEDLPIPPSGIDNTYGGTNVSANSGILKYVRIEYAGFKFINGNESHSLTLAAVGSGTILDHIQITYSGGDGYKIHGGTFNATYLISAGCEDDDFDFDFGYTGTIQYAIGLKAINSAHSTAGSPASADANGIESDNETISPFSATPRTLPVLKHFTILGTSSNNSVLKLGARFRRNSGFDIQNSVIAGFPIGVTNENSASGTFANNVLHAFSITGGAVTPGSNAASANTYLAFGTIGGLSPFYVDDNTAYNIGQLVPRSTSPALLASPANTPYAGAIQPGTAATGTWLKNWTLFNTQTKVY